MPSFFISYEGRLSNKFYFEGGFSLADYLFFSNYTIVIDSAPYKPSRCMSLNSGVVFKQKLFKNFYFTPSLDYYYSLLRTPYSSDQDIYTNYITLGPTIGFEYFISKRISLNTDLLNLNFGLHFHPENQSNNTESYTSWTLTIYKYLSLGIHYNFNWNKGQE
ncbi:MAG: hypothetical protein LH473_13680 [Chitinophagales bacterium]|nr:hypothetical protein [Chitinophagales bacterium]